MKKKKGFTLIELLAVIVVLAVILVIAVPKILDIIEQTEKNAYKESVELMAHTAQIQYKTNEVTGNADVIPEEGIVYEFENGEYKSEKTLNFKGDKPYSGIITLTKNKKVIIEKLVSKNKKWCAIKEEGEKSARVGRSTDEEFQCIVEPDKPVVDKKACELEIGTETINGEEKDVYYVDSPSDLYALSQSVNSGNSYSGKIIKVRNNLDMSNTSNTCGQTSFEPIGTSSNPFSGTFDGGAKVISNLTINKPNENNIGLFGTVKNGILYGIRINKENIVGKEHVSGLIGYIDGNTVIKEIELSEINIKGTKIVSGITDYTSSAKINNIIIKSGKIEATDGVSSFVSPTANQIYTNTIIENVSIKGTSIVKTNKNNNTYYSNNVIVNEKTVTDGFEVEGINDINFYEAAGLDTWIGGDNDNSGYYFDYDSNNSIILKSVKKDPFTFTLKGKGTESDSYLIENEKQWKEISARPLETNYYKLVNNLDFSSKKYYMLGSANKTFQGIINGDDKHIDNVTINGSKGDYLGIIGKMNGAKVYGLILNNINITGNNYVGIIGYTLGNVYGIRTNNIVVMGNDYVGSFSGAVDDDTSVKEIELDNIDVTGNNYVGGMFGSQSTRFDAVYTRAKNILIKSGTVKSNTRAGIVNGNSNSYYSNSIVENLNITGETIFYGEYYSNNVIKNGSNVTSGFDVRGINDINFYEAVGLDTWIGGDNDNSGYYFDYDSNNSVILKSVKKDPFTFTLKGKGTESDSYLIENEKQWKEISARPLETNYYKLVNNLDFSSKKYYMLGSANKTFQGIINGDDKHIDNVTINGSKGNYLGIIGKMNGAKVYGLILNNINITGNNYVGIIGYTLGNVYGIRANNIVVMGNDCVGSFSGAIYDDTSVKEIELDNIDVTGNNYVGGMFGSQSTRFDAVYTRAKNILIKSGTVKSNTRAGIVNGNSNSYYSNSIVENLNITGETIFYGEYYSNNVIKNGSNVTSGFDPSYIGDLDYYYEKVETSIEGDKNNTGYYFDYVYSKGGIYLVNVNDTSNNPPFEPEDITGDSSTSGTCKATYGEWVNGCYLYVSGVHGGYQYAQADDINNSACTGTGNRSAVKRRKITYACN